MIAAGDSEFDVSMLEYADYAIAPEGLACRKRKDKAVTAADGSLLFSEKVLETVLGYIKKCVEPPVSDTFEPF